MCLPLGYRWGAVPASWRFRAAGRVAPWAVLVVVLVDGLEAMMRLMMAARRLLRPRVVGAEVVGGEVHGHIVVA